MTTIVFPGQGAQHKGMCAHLFDEYSDLCAVADEVLGYSIKQLCLEDPQNSLSETQFTQPALFTVNALSYYDFLRKKHKPQFLAGHSLGEYNALHASGVFDFKTGLKLVQKRGELMSQALGGGMLAVIRTDETAIKHILENYQLNGIDIANYNSPSQLVLSGTHDDIKTAKKVFDKEKVFCIPLKVSGAFHSRYMKEAAQAYGLFLEHYGFDELTIPVIANVTGLPYHSATVKQMLVKQLYKSVQWTQSIRYLMAANPAHDILEVGPSRVLTKLNTDILKNCSALSNDKLFTESSMGQDLSEGSFSLGSKEFVKDYAVKYPYVAGSMCHGISSAQLVIKMAQAGFLSFLGNNGLPLARIQELIITTKKHLYKDENFGINVDYFAGNSSRKMALIDLSIKHGVHVIEVSNYDQIGLELVKYRANGLEMKNGQITINNKILIKTSLSKTAALFMQPAPLHLLEKLLQQKDITEQQFQLCQQIPMADDICVEGDGAWINRQAVTMIKLPEFMRLRHKFSKKQSNMFKHAGQIRIGASGGMGTPEAVAMVFAMGADFIVTGSINQCTVEARISDHAKHILQETTTDDTTYAISGELFESGAKSQIINKGSYFSARAQKLYDIYRLHDGLNDVDKKTKKHIEQHFFQRDCDSIIDEIMTHADSKEKAAINNNEKLKMLKVFQWYFNHSRTLAIEGHQKQQKNYQIYCGPSMGAFNQWLEGGPFEKWQNRHVDQIAALLMDKTYAYVKKYQDTLNKVLGYQS